MYYIAIAKKRRVSQIKALREKSSNRQDLAEKDFGRYLIEVHLRALVRNKVDTSGYARYSRRYVMYWLNELSVFLTC